MLLRARLRGAEQHPVRQLLGGQLLLRRREHAVRRGQHLRAPLLADGQLHVPARAPGPPRRPLRAVRGRKLQPVAQRVRVPANASECLWRNASECLPPLGAESCGVCPPGQYSGGGGTPVCLPCAAGSFSPLEYASSCAPCGAGEFAGEGSLSCSRCPAGTSLPMESPRRVNASDCLPSDAGTYTNDSSRGCLS